VVSTSSHIMFVVDGVSWQPGGCGL